MDQWAYKKAEVKKKGVFSHIEKLSNCQECTHVT